MLAFPFYDAHRLFLSLSRLKCIQITRENSVPTTQTAKFAFSITLVNRLMLFREIRFLKVLYLTVHSTGYYMASVIDTKISVENGWNVTQEGKPEYFQRTLPVEHTNTFADKILSFKVLQQLIAGR